MQFLPVFKGMPPTSPISSLGPRLKLLVCTILLPTPSGGHRFQAPHPCMHDHDKHFADSMITRFSLLVRFEKVSGPHSRVPLCPTALPRPPPLQSVSLAVVPPTPPLRPPASPRDKDKSQNAMTRRLRRFMDHGVLMDITVLKDFLRTTIGLWAWEPQEIRIYPSQKVLS